MLRKSEALSKAREADALLYLFLQPPLPLTQTSGPSLPHRLVIPPEHFLDSQYLAKTAMPCRPRAPSISRAPTPMSRSVSRIRIVKGLRVLSR